MPRQPLKSSKIHLKGHRQGKKRNIKKMGPDDLYFAHKHFLMMAIYNVPDTRHRTFKCACVLEIIWSKDLS